MTTPSTLTRIEELRLSAGNSWRQLQESKKRASVLRYKAVDLAIAVTNGTVSKEKAAPVAIEAEEAARNVLRLEIVSALAFIEYMQVSVPELFLFSTTIVTDLLKNIDEMKDSG